MLRPFSLTVHTLILFLAASLGTAGYILSYAPTVEEQMTAWRPSVYAGMGLAYAIGCGFYMNALRQNIDDRLSLYLYSSAGVISGEAVGWVGSGMVQLFAPYGYFRSFLAACVFTGAYMVFRTAAHIWPRRTRAFRRSSH